jgi:hypothetical protein
MERRPTVVTGGISVLLSPAAALAEDGVDIIEGELSLLSRTSPVGIRDSSPAGPFGAASGRGRFSTTCPLVAGIPLPLLSVSACCAFRSLTAFEAATRSSMRWHGDPLSTRQVSCF